MRKRKIKVILDLSLGYIILGVLVLVSLYIFGTNMPRNLLLMYIVFFIVITLIPIFLLPRRASVVGPGIFEVLVGVRRVRISGRVAKVLSTRDVILLMDFCPVGWRVSFDYSFYGICFSDVGRVTVVSTLGCSGVWLMIESDGKKYLVCCEEGDREKCHV
ncbi:MAG: hypothetical protein ACO2PN_09145 [Pyrobaculum sp.]